jgi:nitroreductase
MDLQRARTIANNLEGQDTAIRGMTVIDAILTRVAVLPGNMREPAPAGRDLELILDAAVCAPDHGWLKPWRFLLISGDARRNFGALLRNAYQRRRPEMDEPSLERIRRYPTRIPLLIGVIAAVKESQIPIEEQILSAGAAAQNITLAAHALGYGAMWISSMVERDAPAHAALGLGARERIVGWICVGSLRARPKAKKRPRGLAFAQRWVDDGQIEPATEESSTPARLSRGDAG